tara:strand:+ start:170 stop:412 length:243 start_codon:yes stop_codon:yes gene_type:complete
MTTGFKEELVVLTSNSNNNVVSFLNDLRILLDKHKAKLYATDCELFMNGLGYVGMLEDNIESIEITEGGDVLFSSNIKNS